MADLELATARVLADCINPALAFALVVAPTLPGTRNGLDRGSGRIAYARYVVVCAAGISVAVVLAEAGKHFGVWSGHGGFPSGHETFGAAVAALLIVRDRRWAVVALPVTALLAWSLVRAGYHSPADVTAGFLLGAGVAWGVKRLLDGTSRLGPDARGMAGTAS